MSHLVHFVFLCALLGVFVPSVRAASLFGKVIQVNSGDVITVFNLNRPVRVRLLGVDAPEMDQTFGDVAKKHLSDLVYDKSVLVEYSGITADSSLTGRVLLNNADIGAQMIRDGAAWFDVNNVSRLSVSDREIYQQSELAARSERRGLWQAENPTAPWEFAKAEAFRKNPAARLNALKASDVKARADRPVPELTNLTLMKLDGSNSARTDAPSREEVVKALDGTPKTWTKFRPEGQNFSILVPEGGLRKTYQEPAGSQMVDVNSYLVTDGWARYALTWMKGPTNGRTEESALQEGIQGLLQGAQSGYAKRSGGEIFSCPSVPEKNISMNGYTGKEFDLTSCTVPGKARIYVRIDGDQMQVYMAASVFLEEDPNVPRFLQSFTVGSPQNSKSRKR